MITPLRYQMSEYDCGPTSILNAITVLFHRETIPPELIRGIAHYTLDNYDDAGNIGCFGTSCQMMNYLSFWLTRFGDVGKLPVRAEFLEKSQVHFSEDSLLITALQNGAAIVLRVLLDVGHYILLTGIEGDAVLAFDPYYDEKRFPHSGIEPILDQPLLCNRRIPFSVLMQTGNTDYALQTEDVREALIIYNTEH